MKSDEQNGKDLTKICFVMPYHIIENRGGGAEVQAWLLSRELARRGYEVTYIAQSVQKKERSREVVDGVTVKWIRYVHHYKWASGLYYYRCLKESNPDVVVQRMTSFVTGVIGYYTKRYGKKFIWICTDNWSPVRWFFIKSQINYNRAKKIDPVKKGVLLLNALIYDFSRHFGMKHVTQSLVLNEYQKKALRITYGNESIKLNLGHEIPSILSSPDDRLKNRIILWVGHLGSSKRPEKFIELARLCSNFKFRFIAIGDKDDKKHVSSLFCNKPDNLEWMGRLPFDLTLKWFDQATVVINTSIEEGFSNVIVQAWLRGVPVITLGVNPDKIITKFGLGYVADNVEEASKYLILLTNNEKKYYQICMNISEYAVINFSIEKVADIFLSMLN